VKLYEPSPEENIINQEELMEKVEEASRKIDLLVKMTFRRQEIFDAWYAFNVLSATITAIANAQKISWYQAKKRINTADEIVITQRQALHKIDDLHL